MKKLGRKQKLILASKLLAVGFGCWNTLLVVITIVKSALSNWQPIGWDFNGIGEGTIELWIFLVVMLPSVLIGSYFIARDSWKNG